MAQFIEIAWFPCWIFFVALLLGWFHVLSVDPGPTDQDSETKASHGQSPASGNQFPLRA